MRVCFWGVRGSTPAPLRPSEVKAKIAAILDHALPEDMAGAESKTRFMNGLPPWLFGTAGGNTPCVSVDIEGLNEPIIFDCGSGLREMGIACGQRNPAPAHYHTFFSHFHGDHLIGFPFFGPAYDPSVSIDFYTPGNGGGLNPEAVLQGIMCDPYFPVRMEATRSHKQFHILEAPVIIGPASISYKKMNHPGDSFAYKLSCNGKHFIYATDVELSSRDFAPDEENVFFFKNADIIVLDSQYTLDEAVDKYHWGHNAFSMSVDFAAHWGIKHLVMFHYDPAYDDRKLHEITRSARLYLQAKGGTIPEISMAVEEMEMVL